MVTISPPPTAGEHFRAATRLMWLLDERTQSDIRRRALARRRLTAIDRLLDDLEHRHLMGDRTFDRITRRRVRGLESVVGLPLPRRAVRARNTVRLHAALLDWQEDLLNVIRPDRAEYTDADEGWEDVRPAVGEAS